MRLSSRRSATSVYRLTGEMNDGPEAQARGGGAASQDQFRTKKTTSALSSCICSRAA